MHVPEGQVLKLRKALCGLKQAPRAWYSLLAQSLDKRGYRQCKVYPGLWYKDGVWLLVYVDDILVLSKSNESVLTSKRELLGMFKGRDLGPAEMFLSIHIVRRRKVS